MFWYLFCLPLCVYIWLQIHCWSAFGPGVSRSPQYCAPLVQCVLNVQAGLAVWPTASQTKNKKPTTARVAVAASQHEDQSGCGHVPRHQLHLAPCFATGQMSCCARASCPRTPSFSWARPSTLPCEHTVAGVTLFARARAVVRHSRCWVGVPIGARLYLLNTDCLEGGQVHCGGSSRYQIARKAGVWDAFQRVT